MKLGRNQKVVLRLICERGHTIFRYGSPSEKWRIVDSLERLGLVERRTDGQYAGQFHATPVGHAHNALRHP